MYTTISVLMVLFIVLGTFDGLYYHLFKYKLHLIPVARREHLIHTARAFVFVPIALLLFVYNSSGLLIWSALAVLLLDGYLELIDILEERKSRVPFGGMSGQESAVHVFASSFKFGAVILILSTKNSTDYFSLTPFFKSESLPTSLSAIGIAFAVGSFLGGVYSLFPESVISIYRQLFSRTGISKTND